LLKRNSDIKMRSSCLQDRVTVEVIDRADYLLPERSLPEEFINVDKSMVQFNKNSKLIEIQENERRIIARELHDQIGQSLTAVKLMIALASSSPTDKYKDMLNSAQLELAELIQRVREMSLRLRPSMLDDLGLLPTLIWHFERFTSQTRIQVDFKHQSLQN
jgi:signal transduction histidine kinase